MRIRSIKPEFWLNESLSSISVEACLLAIGLLNHSDDHGYFRADPRIVQAALFPLRVFVEGSTTIRRALDELSSIGWFTLRGHGAAALGHITNFKKHQKIDRPTPSRLEPIWTTLDEPSTSPRRALDEPSRSFTGRILDLGVGNQEIGHSEDQDLSPPPQPRSGGCSDGDLRPDEVRHADDPKWQALPAAATKEAPDCGECAQHVGLACKAHKIEPGDKSCRAILAGELAVREPEDGSEAKQPDIPYDDIVAAYHEKLPALAKCRSHGADSAVRKNIRARWEACTERQDLGWWAAYFADVAEMPWLMGEEPGREGRPPFKATLGWLVLPTNMDKVLNGHYQRKAKPKATKGGWVDENGIEWCPGNCGRPVSDCWCEMYRKREEEAVKRRAAAAEREKLKGAPGAHD